MKNKGYLVDFKKETITITAEFRELAGIVNGTEYREFRQLRKDYPDFRIKYAPKVNKAKVTHKGMTVSWMRQYVENHDNCDMYIDGFNNIIELSKKLNNGKVSCGTVKKHFLNIFPTLTADEIRNAIGVEAATLRIIEESEAKARAKANQITMPTDHSNHAESERDTAA